jgi:hypothetical protein
MANPGKYFLEGFSRTYNPTFQNVLSNLQQRDRQKAIMDEQNRREAEKQKQLQNQSNAFEDVLRGGENVQKPDWYKAGNNVPFTDQSATQFHQYNQDELLGKLKQGYAGDPKGYFNAVQKLLSPKQQQTIKVGNELYLEDPSIKGKPIGESVYTFPEAFKPETITNWGLKRNEAGKIIVPLGHYNETGDWVETNFKTITPTVDKTGDYPHTDLTKETKKDLSDYQGRQQKIKAQLDAVKSGVPVYDTTFWGGKFLLTEEDLTKQLNEVNSEYRNYIENTEPLTTVKFRNEYVKKYGEVRPDSAEDLFDYYASFYNDYLNKKIEPSDYLYLKNDFTAKYGFDPESKFGTALKKK